MIRSDIPPALTAQEWKLVAEGKAGLTGVPNRKVAHQAAVYGQVFGFTHADVGHLRVAAAEIRSLGLVSVGEAARKASDLASALEDTAIRVAALLPPMPAAKSPIITFS